MADETTGAPAPEAPAPEKPDFAALSFDRAADKAKLPEPDGSTNRPSAGVLTGEEPKPRRTRPAAELPAAPDPRLATDDYLRRRTEKRAARERQRQDRIMEVLAREADRLSQQTPEEKAPPAAGDEANPFDRDTQYWEWAQWEGDARDKKLLAAWEEKLNARLGPVQQFFETQAQQHERLRVEAQQRAQQEGWRNQMRELAGDAHEAYSATPEGKDYLDRVAWAIGDPGDPGDPRLGIPPRPARDGAVKIAWLAAGFPEPLADELTRRHLDGMIQLVERLNQEGVVQINPARALDMFSRGLIAAAAPYYTGNGGNGNGHPRPAPAAPSPAQSRVRELKVAAESGVAGTSADTSRSGGDMDQDIKQALSAGRLTPDALRTICKRFVGPATRHNLATLAKRARRIQFEMGVP